jgi:hypothetical protein
VDSKRVVNGPVARASLRVGGCAKFMKLLRFPAWRECAGPAFRGLSVNDRGKGGTNQRRITFGADFPFCSPQHLVCGGRPQASFPSGRRGHLTFIGTALTFVFRHGTAFRLRHGRSRWQNSCGFAQQPPVGGLAADCQSGARMFFVQRAFEEGLCLKSF